MNEDEQRKLIEEFLAFFLGEKKENERDWPIVTILASLDIVREKVIDEFFNSRK